MMNEASHTYDNENQLTRVMVTNAWRSDYQYDARMRLRVRKEYAWKGAVWSLTNEVRYVYDGMLVIQERNASNLPVAACTRGLDLSASLQGAGGIGGLLVLSTLTTVSPQHYYYYADGNGNVAELLDAGQLMVAQYLYDSFGNLLYGIGPLAEANRYRFSSKEFQANAGLYYYGYRFYDPNLQRWVNRDPLVEDGHKLLRRGCMRCYSSFFRDINTFGFCHNEPVSAHDALGLVTEEDCKASLDQDMIAVAAAGTKCALQATVGAMIGVIGTIVGGTFGGAVLGGMVAVTATVIDYCHYTHCMEKTQEMGDAAKQRYNDCMNKVKEGS